MDEVVERLLPKLLESPADNGAPRLGQGRSHRPRRLVAARRRRLRRQGPAAPSLSQCRPRAEPQRGPDHRPQLLWTPMNLICGINPVLEALNSGTRHFDRLLVAKGLRNRRISDAISQASRHGHPAALRDAGDPRSHGGKRAPPGADRRGVAPPGRAPSRSCWAPARDPGALRRSRRRRRSRATSAPSCARPRPRAATACCFPTATTPASPRP